MKVILKTKVDVATLRCDMGVRYWEDGQLNGLQDSDEAPQMPFVSGGRWRIDIDLSSGKIVGWPQGTIANVHYKVCDDGIYSLLDAAGGEVTRKSGYVPAMLSPGGSGWGDYVIMEIGPDGRILNWDAELEYFEEPSNA